MSYKKLKETYIKKIGLICLLSVASIASGMNLIQYYDTLILPEKCPESRYQFYVTGQTGFSRKSFTECECATNALRIWNKDQNALKMLEGFGPNTKMGQLRTALDANDDEIRGHFLVCGDLGVTFAAELGGWFYINPEFWVSMHLPIYSMQLKHVSWKDLTKDITADDARVKNYLTNEFAKNIKELGYLDIGGWKRTGVGDLAVLCGWSRDFEQDKKTLKNVRINARAGITIPTGKKADEDKIFAFPFGNDGAVGFLVGGGLDLSFGSYTRAGIDVQLLHAFGNTRCRRIKTNECQTDLLFLQKIDAFKEFALTQRFNLYLEFFKFVTGLSCKLGYQYVRHGDDMLHLCGTEFSEDIANTAQSLQEWTMHSFVGNISYHFCGDNESDGGFACRSDREVHPYIGLYCKVPFNGMRTAMVRTIGFTLGIDF